ncbi:MAG TPA: glycosyltransferase [Chloroflexota bacterium]
MAETIWLYWEGPQPPYIALAVKTVLAHNADVRMLDRAGFEALFTVDRDLPIDALALNHKSDFIRAYLLRHYGGLYVHADCIVLRDLAPVLDLARQHCFVGYREPQGYMSCNFMASVPGGDVIGDHYERVCAAIRSGGPLEWLDLASVPMHRAVSRHPDASHLLPTELVMPPSWHDSAALTIRRSDAGHASHFQPDAYCYMLSNNTIRGRDQTRILCYMPEAHLLSDRFFISFLFRQALGAAEMSDGATEESAIAPYLGGHEDKTEFDEAALDYLATRFQIPNMVDVGCGQGGIVYYALFKGLRATGVDGDPSLARCCSVIIEHDYTKKPLYLGEFDLGWSVEFLEHVEERYIPSFMATFQGCKHVFITAAVPEQPATITSTANGATTGFSSSRPRASRSIRPRPRACGGTHRWGAASPSRPGWYSVGTT